VSIEFLSDTLNNGKARGECCAAGDPPDRAAAGSACGQTDLGQASKKFIEVLMFKPMKLDAAATGKVKYAVAELLTESADRLGLVAG
jgi:hypothetical protein